MVGNTMVQTQLNLSVLTLVAQYLIFLIVAICFRIACKPSLQTLIGGDCHGLFDTSSSVSFLNLSMSSGISVKSLLSKHNTSRSKIKIS